MTDHPRPYDTNPRAHPGLRAIALVEGIKGLLALLAASGLEILGPLPLRNAVHALIRHFELSSTDGPLAWLASAISSGTVHATAAIAAAYGLLHLVEAWGLWRDKAWASWLGCIAAAIYLPADVFALSRHWGWVTMTVLVVNVVVVYVLARDLLRRRARLPG
ncbi:DUF2127 domain-containing protein [Lysobacter sp. TY2-98]|uniref:DUF2127 domain-containing protein n=1 Tax=Lysobacter sp. TY2-98 TaxID=2290922 RepID=UPI000E203777|nr:DUF2127 domain-containing protein [Lysobacter sp. TY2-98]AXK72515.1 DUF2127 domain-containing protein [Lysobacter sp. TY2-98]